MDFIKNLLFSHIHAYELHSYIKINAFLIVFTEISVNSTNNVSLFSCKR